MLLMDVPLVMKHGNAVHAFHNKEAFYHLHLYTTNKMERFMQFCKKYSGYSEAFKRRLAYNVT